MSIIKINFILYFIIIYYYNILYLKIQIKTNIDNNIKYLQIIKIN